MIQLPEIETIRRDLERDFVGKKIKSIKVTKAKIAGGTKAKSAIDKELNHIFDEALSSPLPAREDAQKYVYA